MATSFYVEHLKPRELRALTEYKYRGEDRSLTYKYIMGPMYNRLIHLLPLWLAPNAVTFIGFLLTVSGHALLMYHAPYFEAHAPPWAYVYAGLALFIYMVLDNLDGKQARRTGSSSPLGHLFDHGCDALNVTLSGMSLLATVQLGADWKSMTLLTSLGHLMTFGATLEEYFTGAMILREFNGPNEGIITLCLFQIFTGLLGPQLWTSDVTIPFSGGLTTKLNLLAFYAALFPTLSAVAGNLAGLLRHLRAQGLSWPRALHVLVRHAAPIVVFGTCFNAWAWLAPHAFRAQMLLVLWLSGAVLFDLISRMILAHLASAAFPFFPRLFWPVILCSGNAVAAEWGGVAVVDVRQATMLTLGVAVVYDGWRIWCLISQLCEFLNVRCFALGVLHKEDGDEDEDEEGKRWRE